jgi:hypothetical protein
MPESKEGRKLLNVVEKMSLNFFDVERARNNLQVRKRTPATTAAATAATATTAEY